MEIDGLQIFDANPVPMDDGSLSTRLVDASGAVVATVTRSANGISTASVDPALTTDSGFDLGKLLNQVTGFLDQVAAAAKQTSDQAQRVSNAVQGAATGARAGYNLPLDLKPWLIAGGVVVGALIIAQAVRRPRRSQG